MNNLIYFVFLFLSLSTIGAQEIENAGLAKSLDSFILLHFAKNEPGISVLIARHGNAVRNRNNQLYGRQKKGAPGPLGIHMSDYLFQFVSHYIACGF
ncbi:MAG TPA: hypothetical protein VL053_16105 [Arachidicoccus sp.]|nr:hypothetical protein [Arachidicoccus sp.]